MAVYRWSLEIRLSISAVVELAATAGMGSGAAALVAVAARRSATVEIAMLAN